MHATATVYDVLGRRGAVLHDGPLGAGMHVLASDAAQVPPGVYVVRAVANTAAGPVVRTARLTIAR